MKRVFSSFNPAEVALVQSMLDSAHIECEMRNESVSQTFAMPFQPEIWIANDEDYEDARHLINDTAVTAGATDAGPV